MNIIEARQHVAGEIARIEGENPVGELRPWMRDACPAASEWWGLVQQRIALSHANPQNTACCRSLNLDPPERTPAQKRAAEANGRRLAAAKAA
jgi:hypothetical protein